MDSLVLITIKSLTKVRYIHTHVITVTNNSIIYIVLLTINKTNWTCVTFDIYATC